MSTGLVYHQGGLGDFVLSLPAIFRVASTRKDTHWHFWGPADRLPLLPGFLPPPPEVLQAGHTLWGTSPDERVETLLSSCEAVLAFGGRWAPRWLARPGEAGHLLLSVFPKGLDARIPVHQRRQLDALGIPRVAEPTLGVWRRSVLPNRSAEEIIVHPGSGDSRKNAPFAAWKFVLSRLKSELGTKVRLVLGPVEQERAWPAELMEEVQEVSICETSAALLAALSRARIFLGNDSGATHLAGLLGIPTVAVFGPSDPALWRPLGPAVRVVRTAANCAPCTDGSPFACRSAKCLEAISPQEVLQAARALAG